MNAPLSSGDAPTWSMISFMSAQGPASPPAATWTLTLHVSRSACAFAFAISTPRPDVPRTRLGALHAEHLLTPQTVPRKRNRRVRQALGLGGLPQLDRAHVPLLLEEHAHPLDRLVARRTPLRLGAQRQRVQLWWLAAVAADLRANPGRRLVAGLPDELHLLLVHQAVEHHDDELPAGAGDALQLLTGDAGSRAALQRLLDDRLDDVPDVQRVKVLHQGVAVLFAEIDTERPVRTGLHDRRLHSDHEL